MSFALPESMRDRVPRGRRRRHMAELQQVGDMNSQGHLADEEFAAAKAKLLGI